MTEKRGPNANELFQTHRIGWQDGACERFKSAKLEGHPLLGAIYSEAYARGRRARREELDRAQKDFKYVPDILRATESESDERP